MKEGSRKAPEKIGGNKTKQVKSGFKGVKKHRNKFAVYFIIQEKKNTVTKYLGIYDTPEEGYKRRCEYLDSLK